MIDTEEETAQIFLRNHDYLNAHEIIKTWNENDVAHLFNQFPLEIEMEYERVINTKI